MEDRNMIPSNISHLLLDKITKTYAGEKKTSSMNGVRKSEYHHLEELNYTYNPIQN